MPPFPNALLNLNGLFSMRKEEMHSLPRRCMYAAFVLSRLNVPALSTVDALAGLVCAAS